MSNSHGDLFREIGKLVLAANAGQEIDLRATAKDLAERYQNLNISEETIASTVSRSIGAIRLGMVQAARRRLPPDARDVHPEEALEAEIEEAVLRAAADGQALAAGRRAKGLFPSGVSLAVLS